MVFFNGIRDVFVSYVEFLMNRNCNGRPQTISYKFAHYGYLWATLEHQARNPLWRKALNCSANPQTHSIIIKKKGKVIKDE